MTQSSGMRDDGGRCCRRRRHGTSDCCAALRLAFALASLRLYCGFRKEWNECRPDRRLNGGFELGGRLMRHWRHSVRHCRSGVQRIGGRDGRRFIGYCCRQCCQVLNHRSVNGHGCSLFRHAHSRPDGVFNISRKISCNRGNPRGPLRCRWIRFQLQRRE